MKTKKETNKQNNNIKNEGKERNKENYIIRNEDKKMKKVFRCKQEGKVSTYFINKL